jgi:hypothetical protein
LLLIIGSWNQHGWENCPFNRSQSV